MIYSNYSAFIGESVEHFTVLITGMGTTISQNVSEQFEKINTTLDGLIFPAILDLGRQKNKGM